MALLSELLTVAIREEDDRAVLVLDGECDTHTAPALADSVDKVLATDPDRVDVDAAALRFADSTALRTLLEAQEQARSVGVDLYIVRPSRPLDRLLKLTGLDQLLLAAPADRSSNPPS
jgi:anti-anti-sigma factor